MKFFIEMLAFTIFFYMNNMKGLCMPDYACQKWSMHTIV